MSAHGRASACRPGWNGAPWRKRLGLGDIECLASLDSLGRYDISYCSPWAYLSASRGEKSALGVGFGDGIGRRPWSGGMLDIRPPKQPAAQNNAGDTCVTPVFKPDAHHRDWQRAMDSATGRV